ncbi:MULTISPECIES: hypothetical protein [Calothrix]|uniref:Uncharacterized protein n=2 Tax=Calothrix TaxID=1186 RepID=A0ABR8AE65_9CYAN|nr:MULTISPECIES: hypothetical protein [Calothrix]MBD2198321.1 hypothetical protein [Calothrix parietina FACHB-288]MBD2226646.1 hypothetical protein [Calothrix anomala FACHB-343]
MRTWRFISSKFLAFSPKYLDLTNIKLDNQSLEVQIWSSENQPSCNKQEVSGFFHDGCRYLHETPSSEHQCSRDLLKTPSSEHQRSRDLLKTPSSEHQRSRDLLKTPSSEHQCSRYLGETME